MRRVVFLILLMVAAVRSGAMQTAMGEWRTHLAFSGITELAQTPQRVYGLASGAVFSIDKRDYVVELHSTLSGLSDTDVSHIGYSEYDGVMMVAYENSNIDLIRDDGEIVNVSDIYRKTFNGSKSINDIDFTKGYAYLATGFGIAVVNVGKYEIADTYTIGDGGVTVGVTDVEADGESIYALTEGVLKYAAARGTNLSNYQNWHTIAVPEEGVESVQILLVEGVLYIVKSNGNMYSYRGGVWSGSPVRGVEYVEYDNGVLFVRDQEGMVTAEGMPAIEGAQRVVYDKGNGALWYSTGANVTRMDLADNTVAMYAPNGPAVNDAWEFAYADNRIFVVPGGRWAVQYLNPGYISYYENGGWNVIWQSELNVATPYAPCLDLVDIEVDPEDKNHFFAASYGMGLYEFRENRLYKVHNIGNRDANGRGIETAIEQSEPEAAQYQYQRVDALQFDDKGNLWMSNPSLHTLKMLDANGLFHYIEYPELVGLETIERTLVSKSNPNIKILLLPRYQSSVTSALFVFDDNGTTDDTSDDRTRLITAIRDQDEKNISLSQRFVRCIEQDKDGVIWVGTTEGIFLLTDIENIFDADYRCNKIKIPRNDGTNLADYLLETEQINDITVDGANRKWIGTKGSGLYLVSDDGLTTIHHFTTDNSPLFSNNVITLEINDRSGELFVGTGKGIISYQSDSNEGGERFDDVHVFPNPVRPEFTGTITVTGLTDETSVRITDVNGNMVYETVSYGGYATWDGCRANGDRVATGIYFAHCVSADRKDKAIVKIMIIN